MGNKVIDELVSTIRSIIGEEYSDMDIIRALHMANNDVTAAINIIFDTPSLRTKPKSEIRRTPEISNPNSSPETQIVSTKSKPNSNETKNSYPRSSSSNGAQNPRIGVGMDGEIGPTRDLGGGSMGSEWWGVGIL